MRVTANQVTLARLLLLPLPVALLYRGVAGEGIGTATGQTWILAALAVYVLLGLTDALDGILARKYGATPLGGLLDPIVDKIFLVAAYIPLADNEVVSTLLVATVFARELLITVLRSIALEEKFEFKTSRIAKLKTTVQMAGGGFLLLIWLYPEERIIWPLLIVAGAAALIPVLVAFARGRTPGWRGTWGAILINGIVLTRLLLSRELSLWCLMLFVVGITLLSGAEYVWDMRKVLAARFRRSPVEALRLVALSSALPAGMMPAMELGGAPVFSIMGVLAAELALGGLDNSLSQEGLARGPWPDLLRAAVQAACGIYLMSVLPGAGDTQVYLAVGIALAFTLGDLFVRFARHFNVFKAVAR